MILQETNTNEVQRILNKAHPELAVREVQPTQHGRSNWVFEVDAEWIFCFPRREDVPFENIVNLLQHAEPRIKLHIPSIEFVGYQPRYVGYRKLGARVLGDDLAAQREAVVTELAAFLCDLHKIDIDTALRLGVPQLPYPGNRDELVSDLERICEDRVWLPFANRCLERVLESRPSESDEALLHHDLHGDNVVVSEDGEVVGVIDFGDACIGDIHRDFKSFCWHGFSCMEAIAASYETRSGRQLDRRRVKDYFCVENLQDIIEFTGQPGSAETRMLDRSERWLEDWSALEGRGEW